MAELIIDILVAAPVFLLWLTIVSVLVRPFGIPLPFTPFSWTKHRSVIQSLTFFTVLDSRRSLVLWLRVIRRQRSVQLSRMEVSARLVPYVRLPAQGCRRKHIRRNSLLLLHFFWEAGERQ